MARKTRAAPFKIPDCQPMAVINTTPLIDLMLVLLIMFIVTVPVATHKVPLDLPGPVDTPAPPAPVHRLNLDAAGRLFWDGRAISDTELPRRLAGLQADPAEPDLHIAAEAETRYERVDQTLAQVKRAGIDRLGFIGNQRFASELDPS
jgi:biopolymer transport protein ExbD